MTEKLSGASGLEGDYHLFLSAGDTKRNCAFCGRETNFKLFDGYFRDVGWCCPNCYDEKFGPKRKKT